MKKILTIFLALTMVIGSLVGCSGGDKSSSDSKAKVSIVLVLEDQTEKNYEIECTEGTSLREALYEGGLITEETYGAMFVDTIDGNTADTINDGVTWMPTDSDGKQIMGTYDEITVTDGQTIRLVYTVVPDMD